jgi:hypothetical protein
MEFCSCKLDETPEVDLGYRTNWVEISAVIVVFLFVQFSEYVALLTKDDITHREITLQAFIDVC